MGRAAMGLYTRFLLDLDVQHCTPLPSGAKIIAPNHPTTLDPFLMPAIFKERTYILITETAFKAPLFGKYLRAVGHIEVIAQQGRLAFDAARKLLEAGETVVIFPEGALSPLTGGYAKVHTGVVRLSLLTGAPIVPVGIGLQPERIRFLHTGIKDHFGQEEVARIYLRAPYAVTFGGSLTFDAHVENRALVQMLSDKLMRQIMRLSAQSACRIDVQRWYVNLRDTAEIHSI
jgi:1-acyl-sn-glycerol-3-phosphate acyltransferase